MKKVLIICTYLLSLKLSGQIETDCESQNEKILNYMDAKKYITNYHDLYKTTVEKKLTHTKAYYINSKTLLFLDDFFKNSSYLGVNIYLMSYENLTAKGQVRKKQNLPYLVPVSKVKYGGVVDTVADFRVLKNYFNTLPTGTYTADSLNKGIACKGKCDDSLLSWTGDPLSNNFRDLPGNITNTDMFLLTDDISTHKTKRSNYKSNSNSEAHGFQTKWTFLDTTTIHRLAYFLRHPGNINQFPLIGIYYGSYNMRLTPRQPDPDQTMLILIPLRKMSNNNYVPDPCAYVNFHNSAANKKMFFGENHSELCPEACPPGGN